MFNVTWINKAAERRLGLRRSTSSGRISGGSFRNRPSISSTFQTRSRPTSSNPCERNDYALRFEAMCRAQAGGRSVGSNIRPGSVRLRWRMAAPLWIIATGKIASGKSSWFQSAIALKSQVFQVIVTGARWSDSCLTLACK